MPDSKSKEKYWENLRVKKWHKLDLKTTKDLLLYFNTSLNLIIFFADKNECKRNNGNCSQYCFNEKGSYRCDCEIGYLLKQDRRNCKGKGTEILYCYIRETLWKKNMFVYNLFINWIQENKGTCSTKTNLKSQSRSNGNLHHMLKTMQKLLTTSTK